MSSLKPDTVTCHILCCMGDSCKKSGAEHIYRALKHEIKEHRRSKEILLTKTHCNHLCKRAPVVILYPSGAWYGGMSPNSAKKLVRRYVRKRKKLTSHLIAVLQDSGSKHSDK